MVTIYLAALEEMVRKCRAKVRGVMVGYQRLKKVTFTGAEKRTTQFVVVHRVTLWRNAVKEVLEVADSSFRWDEETRKLLWKVIIAATRDSWYCTNMFDTLNDCETVYS